MKKHTICCEITMQYYVVVIFITLHAKWSFMYVFLLLMYFIMSTGNGERLW